jgi:D-serine ammonia-lyase
MDYSRVYQASTDKAFTDLRATYEAALAAYLKSELVGRKLRDINAPAAVLDRAALKKNCSSMLDLADSLNLSFRAHVKTHKV